MWLEKPFVSSCNPSVYYNWSERPNIVLHEYRFNEVRGSQGNNFCSGIIEKITSRTSSRTYGDFKIPRSENLYSKSSWTVYWKKDLRKDRNLSISFVKAHKRITTSTISMWCVRVLKNVSEDVTVFGSRSTRSSSTAHCKKEGIFYERNK